MGGGGRIGESYLSSELVAGWWILLEVGRGRGCLPYQMGLEDEDVDEGTVRATILPGWPV